MSREKLGLLYSKDHEWVELLADGCAVVGITDFAQKEMGDIVFVELPEVDDELATGESFSSIESVKAVSEVFLPVAGKVIEINKELEDAPELLNQEPYDAGWIVKIELLSEVSGLLTADEYAEYLKELE
jgi:glycine cleavage system H protein